MLSFREFIGSVLLYESIDNELLGHLTHAKDIPHELPDNVHTAIDLLEQFHKLRQGKESTISASLKHDGGASVHIVHHEDGRVGVTDKHRLARGVIAYSDEEIDHHFGKHPEYASSLKHLLRHGHEVVGRGRQVQGDILWTQGDKTSKREGRKTSYTPNRITYHADSDAPIGIALHTEVKNGVAQAPSKGAIKTSKNIFVPRVDFNPEEHEYSMKDQVAVEEHLKSVREIAVGHTTSHLTKDHVDHIKIYNNRVGRGHRNPTVEGYMTYLRSRGEEEAAKRSSVEGKQNIRSKFDSMATHVAQNQSHFARSIQIRHHLEKITDHGLSGIKHPDLETTLDGEKSIGEGIVLQRKDAIGRTRPVAKLVHSDTQYALGNNPLRFKNRNAIT